MFVEIKGSYYRGSTCKYFSFTRRQHAAVLAKCYLSKSWCVWFSAAAQKLTLLCWCFCSLKASSSCDDERIVPVVQEIVFEVFFAEIDFSEGSHQWFKEIFSVLAHCLTCSLPSFLNEICQQSFDIWWATIGQTKPTAVILWSGGSDNTGKGSTKRSHWKQRRRRLVILRIWDITAVLQNRGRWVRHSGSRLRDGGHCGHFVWLKGSAQRNIVCGVILFMLHGTGHRGRCFVTSYWTALLQRWQSRWE